MSRITSEFYCGECNGYFFVRLNIGLDRDFGIICPMCGHKHFRQVKGGVIVGDSMGRNDNYEEIRPTKSAYHKESVHSKMKKFARAGSPIESANDIKPNFSFLRERWVEIFGDRS